MTTLPNWLLISGSGRNVGKTSLICRIIHEITDLKPVTVKISSHLHPLPEDSEWIIRKEDYAVIRETRINSKDSSKMLQSGAASAYYAQGPDFRLPEILSALTPFTQNNPVICESGGLRKLIVPGVYLLIKGDDNQTKPGIESLELHADKVLTPADFRTGSFEKHLLYKNNRWIITL
jgi:hypothetical protein